MRLLSLLIFLLIVLLGISFSTLNSTPVTFYYFLGNKTFPLSLLLVLTLAAGALLGILVGLWFLLKIKLQNVRLKRQLSLAQKEIQNLRAIPQQRL